MRSGRHAHPRDRGSSSNPIVVNTQEVQVTQEVPVVVTAHTGPVSVKLKSC
jgi:hypothetical protein